MPRPDPSETHAIALAEAIDAAVHLTSLRIAVAESMTDGAIAARLAAAPHASDWFAGGVVTSTVGSKKMLGRDRMVSARAAEEMAVGVSKLKRANLALSVTGVCRAGDQDAQDVGTIFIGVRSPRGEVHVAERRLGGSPDEIVDSAVVAALRLLEARVDALVAHAARVH